jgi:hypothetical protein
MSIMKRMLALFFVGVLAAGIVACQSQKPAACDRACLEGIADQYLAAMVAHDASKAPFAENLIFTENAIKLPPTEGLWFTASGLSDYKFYLCDLKEGQVAWVGIAKEHDKPVLLSLRLKVVNRRITEAESIVVRDVSERNLGNLKTPPPAFSEILAPSERVSRQEMLRIPELYFEGLDKLNDRAIPFGKDCYRLENGMLTAGTFPGAAPAVPGMPASPGCANGDISPMLKTIYNVRPRRTPLVDEEKGVTWGVYCFNHRGLATIKMPDGSIQPSYFTSPNTMPAAEIFKTKNGKIRDIFAYGVILPYGIGDGWSGPVFK